MVKKKRRTTRIVIFIFILLVAGGFVFNGFLTYRLESRLNNILSKEISQATDGFYNFSFDRLKIGFFSGELSIWGVNLSSDSLTYTQWEKEDNLPNIYYDINIGEIHFKGINLTWIWDYSNLNFSLFQVDSPNIKIYTENTLDTGQEVEKKTENEKLNDLYEIVSPYIDVLTVKRINLKNANITYTIKDPISPIVYALKGAKFRAYNFRLDKDSSVSGKLLFSDDFEFKADSPQTLIYSDQLILNTDNIKLSTLESLIKIEGVHVSPKDSLWSIRSRNVGDYLKAGIELVEMKGVKFERENSNNYLKASSFDITSTSIEYYSIKGNTVDLADNLSDTVDEATPQSLYSILSPILNSVLIDKIDIEKTKFNYTLKQDGYTDVYRMEEFNFHANEFLVDSLSEKKNKFWYVNNFTLEGAGINGEMQSNNANVSVAALSLDTKEKKFSIKDIGIKPLTPDSTSDYIGGSLKSIAIDGLEYNRGLSANRLLIESPVIYYFRINQEKREKAPDEKIRVRENILDFFTPYADFLSVKSINLSDANITVRYNDSPEVYHIEDLDFYATHFLVNNQTRRTSRYLFTFEDAGLSLKNFDNNIPGSNYRLKIGALTASSLTGRAKLKDVSLSPKTDALSGMRYNFQTPLLKIEGVNNHEYLTSKAIEVKSILLDSPNISVEKDQLLKEHKKEEEKESVILSDVFSSLKIDTIGFSKASISYIDHLSGDSLLLSLHDFEVRELEWIPNQSFDIDRIALTSPNIRYVADRKKEPMLEKDQKDKSVNTISEPFGGLAKKIGVRDLLISDLKLKMKQPTSDIEVDIPRFSFDNFKWDFSHSLSFGKIDLQKPMADISLLQKKDKKTKDTNSSKDLYELLKQYTGNINIDELNVSSVNVDYKSISNNKDTVRQTVNSTDLFFKDLLVDNIGRKAVFSDMRFYTKDIYYPVMDGFYTIGIDAIKLDKGDSLIALDNVRLMPSYPKDQFAYIHPRHKDWFDVAAKDIILTGADYDALLFNKTLKAKKMVANNLLLQNFKNQKIEIEHNVMPLIYEGLHSLPLKLFVDSADISDFTVIYEELPKNGNIPGVIRFDHMNGKIANLTNVASYPNQYMRLDADGLFMGEGYFTAIWDIPISPDYDCFVLEAQMYDFDLRALNETFIPLAKVEVKRGRLNSFTFRTEASSKDAYAQMLFLYDSINVHVLKDSETKETKKMLSNIANAMVKTSNPSKGRKHPRQANIYIERDPYHSTFNYFWQILQPALIESAGFSQKRQNRAKKTAGFFTKVKNFFSGDKKKYGENEKPE